MLDIAAICLVVTALLAYLNHRFVRLPTTIGVMAIALGISLVLLGLNALGLDHGLRQYEESFLRSIDFSDVLMQGMLSFLLFAGALHVDLRALRQYRWQIAVLALVGTMASTLVVGTGMWLVLPFIGVQLPFLYCLLFGALISPTDPIAVMGILNSAGAPKNLELVIAGESLFNDGVGVVIFALLLGVLTSGSAPTLTAVMGGYALASHLHVSGPLAMVVCGLMIGNGGRALAMSDHTRRYIDMFWELLDEILNAVLFVLIGLEVLLIAFTAPILVAGVVAIVVTLAARWITVGLPVGIAGTLFRLPHGSPRVLAWGGLRGGISVALALSLPVGAEREIILALTYCVVVFSILVQGLTIGRVVRSAIGAVR
jgi:CPA1 family monovalent cation:H+ antiporter